MDEEVATLGSPAADEKIADDWKAITEKYAVEPVEEVKDEKPGEDKVEKPEKARDEKGKFAKPDKAEPAAKDVVQTVALADAPAQAAETAPVDGRDLNRAPSSWKPAAKAAWATLPPEIRTEIQRREGDFLNGQAGLLPDAQLGKSMRQIIEPHAGRIQAVGGAEKAIAGLLQTEAVLSQGQQAQKIAAIQELIRYYGVQMPQPQIGADGQVQAIQPQQTFSDPRVDTLLARMEAQQRAQESSDSSRRQTVINKWENETDAKGLPLRPYVANVIDEMVAIIPQVRARNPGLGEQDVLQQSYESAIWAHPEIRPLLQKQQQDELEAKRREETLRKSADARKAASVNVPRRSALAPQAAKGSMEETIRETARTLGMIN